MLAVGFGVVGIVVEGRDAAADATWKNNAGSPAVQTYQPAPSSARVARQVFSAARLRVWVRSYCVTVRHRALWRNEDGRPFLFSAPRARVGGRQAAPASRAAAP